MNNYSTASMYKNISPSMAVNMMKDISTYTILLDVRRSDEYAAGHIRGAVNIPLSRIMTDSAKLLPDKDREIIVYCHSGVRSKTACLQLCNMGYTKVFDLGGIIDWPFEIALN